MGEVAVLVVDGTRLVQEVCTFSSEQPPQTAWHRAHGPLVASWSTTALTLLNSRPAGS